MCFTVSRLASGKRLPANRLYKAPRWLARASQAHLVPSVVRKLTLKTVPRVPPHTRTLPLAFYSLFIYFMCLEVLS